MPSRRQHSLAPLLWHVAEMGDKADIRSANASQDAYKCLTVEYTAGEDEKLDATARERFASGAV